MNYHYRRYSKKRLIDLISKANFKIEKSSYWNFILFLPTALIKIINHYLSKGKNKSDQLFEVNPMLNKFLTLVLKLENLLIEKINLPIGISVFVVARK